MRCLAILTLGFPGIVVFVCLLATAPALAVAQRPEPHVIRFGPLTLKFEFCPPGEVHPGWPGNPQSDIEEVRPFWIGQSEVSQSQFEQVLTLDQAAWRKRAAQLKAVDLTLRTDIQDYRETFTDERTASDYPIYNLTVLEAAEFCRSLGRLAKKYRSDDSFSAYKFRLPTDAEWQYACRARVSLDEQKKLPHFNRWVPKIRNAGDLWGSMQSLARTMTKEEFIKKFKRDAMAYQEFKSRCQQEFDGSQLQIYELLADARAARREILAISVVEEILRKNYSIEYKGFSAHLAPVFHVRGSNDWGLHHIVGNAAEWVLASRDDSCLLVESPKPDGVWPPRELVVKTAGGSYNTSLLNFKRFTAWGAKEISATAAVDPRKMRFEQAGVRVLLEVPPPDDFRTSK